MTKEDGFMSIEIDLKPYGKEGVIVLDEPSFAKVVACQDGMIGVCLSDKDLEKIGELESVEEKGKYTQQCLIRSPSKLAVIYTMAYVKSAPFLPDDDENIYYKEFMSNMTQELYDNINQLIKANFKPIQLMQ